MRHIAVRELAYFMCQSGNLTSEFFSNRDMQSGIEAHRHHQRTYNNESRAEVFIKQELNINDEDFQLTGIIDDWDPETYGAPTHGDVMTREDR